MNYLIIVSGFCLLIGMILLAISLKCCERSGNRVYDYLMLVAVISIICSILAYLLALAYAVITVIIL